MRTLSCASGASIYIMGMCLLNVTIQGQTTENLQFFICHDKYCRIGAQVIIGHSGMKKLKLRDDPESDSIIMKRTKEVAGIELSGLNERDPYPFQTKREFRIPPRSVMPVSFENNLPDNLLFFTEINKDLEDLEGLTIVPGILDNKTRNFCASISQIVCKN